MRIVSGRIGRKGDGSDDDDDSDCSDNDGGNNDMNNNMGGAMGMVSISRLSLFY